MTNPIIGINDLSTDTFIEREMTQEELISYQATQAAVDAAEEAAAEKAAARAALLAKLGITEEEAQLLLS